MKKNSTLPMIVLPIITTLYATIESPFKFTMSNIGSKFSLENYIRFIMWGILSAICIYQYITYMYKKVDYADQSANKLLTCAVVALIVTVITPALKDVLPVLYSIHLLCSIVLPICLVMSIVLFIKYLLELDYIIANNTILLLLEAVLLPIITWVIMGFNGFVELVFFIMLSISLIALNKNIDANDSEADELSKQKENV